ncbi:MAG: DUF72 domain-containing protein [candidate division Zixibacteria bacterium]|nr:DUF72 domain-containing protein [candidate division Zixibacteria bacterium]
MNVRVGTSGFSFADWRGNFYPPDIDKGKLLDYYVRKFDTVEINSTYYGIPQPRVFENMAKKVSDQFDFMVKVPQSFTHRRTDLDNDCRKFTEAMRPLSEFGKLAGLLAQFPYSFKFSPDNLDYISICRQAVVPHPLFVEFRHNSWVNRTMYDRFRAEGIGYVAVDEPSLPGLLNPDCFATTDTVYIRLHGRNAEQWWDGGPLRYDYKYSEDELASWKNKLAKIMKKVKTGYVFFNNCHLGQAARNASQFAEMIATPENET